MSKPRETTGVMYVLGTRGQKQSELQRGLALVNLVVDIYRSPRLGANAPKRIKNGMAFGQMTTREGGEKLNEDTGLEVSRAGRVIFQEE